MSGMRSLLHSLAMQKIDGNLGDDVPMPDAAATNASGCVNGGGKRAALEREQAVKSALRRGFLT
eukprot:8051149-Ditylum_brightwellii.AAC.1